MTQPAQPQHIPGLITANGTTPNQAPGQPIPAAQPGTTVPGQVAAPATPAVPAQPAAVAPATAQPTVVSSAVQPAPATDPNAVPQQPVLQLPTNLLPQATTTTTAGVVPGLSTVTVPGLNPPAPQTPAPAAAAPSTPPPADPAQQPATGSGETDRGYPQGTPLEQMTSDQREAYWKFHARQWETRAKEKGDYDALKTKAQQYDQYLATQATEQDKAVAAAKAAGYQEAAAKAAVVLVDAHVRAGLMGRLGPDQVEVLATNLNHQHFLAADGLSVDAAKVATFISTVAPQHAAPAATAPAVPAVPGALPVGVPQPAAPQPQQPVTGLPRALPDLGQGAQTTAPLDKLEAGRQAARQFLADGGSFR